MMQELLVLDGRQKLTSNAWIENISVTIDFKCYVVVCVSVCVECMYFSPEKKSVQLLY